MSEPTTEAALREANASRLTSPDATLVEALEAIANGPWPKGYIDDTQRIARAALAAARPDAEAT